eukprot:TRINITY_DN3010_c0_g2_i1.p1 TRINITY_DN3010_c0_g2~~TRINITY_DN3010_c0_g2_i1.p1  ORF type:complete len:901 (-),score=332.61 TRINITY_DN3010_c0_g2_i1:7-2709(-)
MWGSRIVRAKKLKKLSTTNGGSYSCHSFSRSTTTRNVRTPGMSYHFYATTSSHPPTGSSSNTNPLNSKSNPVGSNSTPTTKPQNPTFNSTPTTATPAAPKTPSNSSTNSSSAPTTATPAAPNSNSSTNKSTKSTTPPPSYHSVSANARPSPTGVPSGVYIPPPEQTGRPLLPGEIRTISSRKYAYVGLFAVLMVLLYGIIYKNYATDVLIDYDPEEERLKKVVETPLPVRRRDSTSSSTPSTSSVESTTVSNTNTVTSNLGGIVAGNSVGGKTEATKRMVEEEQQHLREKEAQQQQILAQQIQSALQSSSPSTNTTTTPAPVSAPTPSQGQPPATTQAPVTAALAASQEEVARNKTNSRNKQKNTILEQEDIDRNYRNSAASRKMAARQRDLKMKEAQLEEEREMRAREEQRRNSGFVPKIHDEETEEADNDLSESELMHLQHLINRNKEREKQEEIVGLQATVDPEARYLKDVISKPPKTTTAAVDNNTRVEEVSNITATEGETAVVIPLVSLVPNENGLIATEVIVVEPIVTNEDNVDGSIVVENRGNAIEENRVQELAGTEAGVVVEESEEERSRREREEEHGKRVEELNRLRQDFERIKTEHETSVAETEREYQTKVQSLLAKETGVVNKERELFERLIQMETEHIKKQEELALFYDYKLQTAINDIVEEESKMLADHHQTRVSAMDKKQIDYDTFNNALSRLHSNVAIQALGTKVLLLKDRLNRHNDTERVQYYKELVKAKQYIDNSNEELMKNVIAELDEEVAKEGIYGVGELRGEFERRKKYLIRAQFVRESGGFIGHLAGFLFGRLSWNWNDNGGDRSKLREVMDRVDKADLYGAVAILEEIRNPWVRELVDDWIDEARKTMYANQSVKLLNAEMIIRLEEERVLTEAGIQI